MARFVALLGLLVLSCSGCGGGGSGAAAGTPDGIAGSDAAAGSDGGGGAAADGVSPTPDGVADVPGPAQDGVAPVDTAGPAPDLGPLDVPAGDGAFGDPCTSGAQCTSGICWATSVSQGCTEACETDADCAAWGAQCRWIREGVRGCGPPTMTGNPQCADNADCVWPYVCREDLAGCELPECRFDGDCAEGLRCDVRLRRCVATSCTSSVECPFPGEFCIAAACGPPSCQASADCPQGQACFRTDGMCRVAPACDENGECGFYNEMCENGLCVPNPCHADCADAAATCDPETGRCHRPCGAEADCPGAQKCDTTRGRCYEDHAPIAVAGVSVGGQLRMVADVARGAVTVDGSASVDPDGTLLTYRWWAIEVPPGSTLAAGQALPPGPRSTFQADAPGRYAIGLQVEDGAGTPSAPATTILHAE